MPASGHLSAPRAVGPQPRQAAHEGHGMGVRRRTTLYAYRRRAGVWERGATSARTGLRLSRSGAWEHLCLLRPIVDGLHSTPSNGSTLHA